MGLDPALFGDQYGLSYGVRPAVALKSDVVVSSSGAISLSSSGQSLYSQITSSNYGDYVDLGTSIVTSQTIGEDSSGNGGTNPAEDWRIFYKDTENNKVYLILSDYLPYSYESTLGTGLLQYSTDYPYNWMSTSRTNLLTKLGAGSTWKKLIQTNTSLYNNSNVTVAGAIDLETWVKSWNESGYTTLYTAQTSSAMSDGKYGYYIGTSENPTTYSKNLSSYTTGYGNTLYFPHKSSVSDCYNYWLTSPSAIYANGVMGVGYDGSVSTLSYGSHDEGVRAVVSLPSDIQATSSTSGGVTTWTVGD